MRVVGELLVARGAFPLLVQRLSGGDAAGVAKDLKEAGSNISRIAEELQTSVMSIRMLAVKTVFQRFPRLVRDLARSLGKEVRLVIEGEGIELDKTILEQIGDPLVHVIRNAVDHGIELPEDRRLLGKDKAGQLTLRAIRKAGGVSIEITDDGRGLDADALKRKAVGKGLLTPEARDIDLRVVDGQPFVRASHQPTDGLDRRSRRPIVRIVRTGDDPAGLFGGLREQFHRHAAARPRVQAI
jgi:two-component system chemotaxis sensor kinase CheA